MSLSLACLVKLGFVMQTSYGTCSGLCQRLRSSYSTVNDCEGFTCTHLSMTITVDIGFVFAVSAARTSGTQIFIVHQSTSSDSDAQTHGNTIVGMLRLALRLEKF
jgi:hypothetical protein